MKVSVEDRYNRQTTTSTKGDNSSSAVTINNLGCYVVSNLFSRTAARGALWRHKKVTELLVGTTVLRRLLIEDIIATIMEKEQKATAQKIQRGEDAINKIEEVAGRKQIEFLQDINLSYAGDDEANISKDVTVEVVQVCFSCKSSQTSIEGAKLFNCAKCRVAAYCSKQCQVTDWKAGHKHACQQYAKVGKHMTFKHISDKRQAIVNGVLSRIRFYSGPFAIHHHSKQGRGFLFIQSECTLAEMSLVKPTLSTGKVMEMPRSVLIHFLTMGEYDQELCRDDFELAVMRDKLKDAVERYDFKTELVIMTRFRCGHISLLMVPLVPDYGISLTLSEDYEGRPGAMQLNIDST